MKMNGLFLALVISICFGAVPAQGGGLKVATICAGAATLNNGSVIIIGQPFVGVMSAPDGQVSVSTGLLPALLIEKNWTGPLAIGSTLSFVGGQFQFCFPTQPGRNYVVHASTNLSDWTPIWTNVGTWTGLTFEDADAMQFPYRFYKVEAP